MKDIRAFICIESAGAIAAELTRAGVPFSFGPIDDGAPLVELGFRCPDDDLERVLELVEHAASGDGLVSVTIRNHPRPTHYVEGR